MNTRTLNKSPNDSLPSRLLSTVGQGLLEVYYVAFPKRDAYQNGTTSPQLSVLPKWTHPADGYVALPKRTTTHTSLIPMQLDAMVS